MRALIIGLIALGTAQAALADDPTPYPDGVVQCLKGSCHDGDASPTTPKTPDWRQARTTAKAFAETRYRCELCEHPYRVSPLRK